MNDLPGSPEERFVRALEDMGEEEVNAGLTRGRFAANAPIARAWIDRRERARAVEAQRQAEMRAEVSLSLSERATKAAEESAVETRRTARWTFWAAIGAMIAAVASLVQVFISR